MNELENEINKINMQAIENDEKAKQEEKEQKRLERKKAFEGKKQAAAEGIKKVIRAPKTAVEKIIENINHKKRVQELQESFQTKLQEHYKDLSDDFENNRDKIGTSTVKVIEGKENTLRINWDLVPPAKQQITTIYTEHGPITETLSYYSSSDKPVVTLEGFFPTETKKNIVQMEYLRISCKHIKATSYDKYEDHHYITQIVHIPEEYHIWITTKDDDEFKNNYYE